ncbi:LLM class flavin-dependent oxidoreductase [Microbacterium sp. ET2]|uniref:LLM class flavin-dependent oxidoreductase n=1 Tax=Microbacterium albipurpureum TaxID=3050384 RepID=UPI00259D112B|nr:LLM class flavin-dependent oxidoreductase [Microbacterium sp. ET2 (Ac-2212)]WJL96643.1 LLM class flavin-dependent oxidoreductase [Microbacterium sp. ET2 (Ac-2212)]
MITATQIRDLEFGVNSFGDVATDGGRPQSDEEALLLLVDEAQLAESVGLDSFSVGEHYREGMVDSATPVILAGIAQATSTVRLGTSVTVLSTQDPVRLYQQFATVDGLSRGRTQLVLGRASAIESFSLFGYDIEEYEQIFEEKLDLFLRLMREDRVTWSGRYRPPLDDVRLHPRMPEGGIPTWIGVGGSPDSVVRAARHGLPLMMAVIAGRPERFAGHAELYLRALARFERQELPIGQHSIGFIADSDEEAKNTYWKYWRPVVAALNEERGFYPPTAERYETEVSTGALYVGSPETVSQKIASIVRANHLSRFDLKYDVRHLPREARAHSIRLFGERVVPRVRELLHENPGDWRLTGRTPAEIVKGGRAVHA